jgi:uncharacterized membrane protein
MPATPVFWRRAFVAASILWGLSLPLATRVAAGTSASSAEYVFSFGVYAIGSLICHQRPARSFHLWTAQMPVCARCVGIYAGAAVAAIAAALWRNVGRKTDARWLLAAAAIPTLATLALEWGLGISPGNVLRASAGVPLGSAVAIVVVHACDGETPDGGEPRRGRVS